MLPIENCAFSHGTPIKSTDEEQTEKENLYCSDCIHKDVCGLEGLLDEGMTFCASKKTKEEMQETVTEFSDRCHECGDVSSRQKKMQEICEGLKEIFMAQSVGIYEEMSANLHTINYHIDIVDCPRV